MLPVGTANKSDIDVNQPPPPPPSSQKPPPHAGNGVAPFNAIKALGQANLPAGAVAFAASIPCPRQGDVTRESQVRRRNSGIVDSADVPAVQRQRPQAVPIRDLPLDVSLTLSNDPSWIDGGTPANSSLNTTASFTDAQPPKTSVLKKVAKGMGHAALLIIASPLFLLYSPWIIREHLKASKKNANKAPGPGRPLA